MLLCFFVVSQSSGSMISSVYEPKKKMIQFRGSDRKGNWEAGKKYIKSKYHSAGDITLTLGEGEKWESGATKSLWNKSSAGNRGIGAQLSYYRLHLSHEMLDNFYNKAFSNPNSRGFRPDEIYRNYLWTSIELIDNIWK